MSQQPFALIPFSCLHPESNLESPCVNSSGNLSVSRVSISDLSISGTLTRHAQQLAIQYCLVGDLTQIAIAEPADPMRQENLWQTTCFEFFLGMQNLPTYWEFNLSPAGHWNVYRFDAYRQGMRQELAFSCLPFRIQRRSEVGTSQVGTSQLEANQTPASQILKLSLELDLSVIVSAGQAIDVAIATVIQSTDGEITYWALSHPDTQADFHHRASFMLQV